MYEKSQDQERRGGKLKKAKTMKRKQREKDN